jgi:ParB/RepB/Spo0J family partition protein
MEITEISLDLIDHPDVELRTTVDQEYIESLAKSIKEVGLLHPLRVKSVDGRYTIISGNCRYLACKLAGMAQIPCIVTVTADSNIPAMTLHENLIRQEVNHMDISRYLVYLRDNKKMSVDILASTFRYSTTWVYQHLKILEADEYIRNAIDNGALTYQAGLELMKIPDETRRYSLFDSAVRAGANLGIVKSWVAQELCQLGIRPSAPPITPPPGGTMAPELSFTCALCLKTTPNERMIMIRVCADDYRVIMDAIKILRDQERAAQPEGAKENAGAT